jgi:hypothetical protein
MKGLLNHLISLQINMIEINRNRLRLITKKQNRNCSKLGPGMSLLVHFQVRIGFANHFSFSRHTESGASAGMFATASTRSV